MTCDVNSPESCWLGVIATSLQAENPWVTVVLPLASIMVTLLLGVATTYLAYVSLHVSRESTELARRATLLAEREERRPFGDALQAYYETRRRDIYKLENKGLPHYTDAAEVSAKRVNAPNAELLLRWLKTSIDHALEDGTPEEAGVNAYELRGTVPAVIAAWVGDPVNFNPLPFRLWHEKHPGIPAPQAITST